MCVCVCVSFRKRTARREMSRKKTRGRGLFPILQACVPPSTLRVNREREKERGSNGTILEDSRQEDGRKEVLQLVEHRKRASNDRLHPLASIVKEITCIIPVIPAVVFDRSIRGLLYLFLHDLSMSFFFSFPLHNLVTSNHHYIFKRHLSSREIFTEYIN